MSPRAPLRPSDLRGAARLATDATAGLTDLVEALHERIVRGPIAGEAALAGRTYVVPDDVAALAEPVLAHRLILHPESAVAGTSESSVIESVLERVPVPEPVQP